MSSLLARSSAGRSSRRSHQHQGRQSLLEKHYSSSYPQSSTSLPLPTFINPSNSPPFSKISFPSSTSSSAAWYNKFTSRPRRLPRFSRSWTGSTTSNGSSIKRPWFSFFFKGRSAHRVSSWNSGTPIWKYLRVAFVSILLIWSIYCMIRYFMSLTVYDHDPTRSHVAISLGTLSSLAVLFFGLETSTVYALAMHLHIDRKLRDYIHFLTYFASSLIIIPAIVNIGIVIAWRRPKSFEEFDRVIEGRCTWDVDAVWTGTGMSCFGDDALSFGVWLGAGLVRLLFTLSVVGLYFFVARCFPKPEEEPMPLPLEAGSQMDELTTTDRYGNHAEGEGGEEDCRKSFFVEDGIVYYNRTKQQSALSFTSVAGRVGNHNHNTPSDPDSDEGEDDTDMDFPGEPASAYSRVLTEEPEHDQLSLSQTSNAQRSSASVRSNSSRGSVLLGPRPKPPPPGKKTSTSTLRSDTLISSTNTATIDPPSSPLGRSRT